MADFVKTSVIFAFFVQNIHCYVVYSKLPEVYSENNRSHLKFEHINVICDNRTAMCKSNNTKVCAVRLYNGSLVYRDFENSCVLFLSNMCDYPGEEYNIVEGGTCKSYHASRRLQRRNNAVNATTPRANTTVNATLSRPTSTLPGLRTAAPFSPLYLIESAYDLHPCPLRCPDTYSPVCLSANRKKGKYFRFWRFVNHCMGDVYYCKHWTEFGPPPGEDMEDVMDSPLSWSFCGAFRYMQFARFSEVLSSMGHYGWLVGDERYSAIMPPGRRPPSNPIYKH